MRLSTYALKPRFQSVLRPFAAALGSAGVSANQVTIFAAAASVVIGAVVAWRLPDTRAFLLIPAWLFLRMALNCIDGMIARDFAQQSRLGLFLNELGDVVSDVALYLPFALVPAFSPVLVLLVVVLALLSEYAGVLGLAAGGPRRNDGPMGKSDRAIVFGALALWTARASPPPEWSDAAMLGIAALLVLTIVNRLRHALRPTA